MLIMTLVVLFDICVNFYYEQSSLCVLKLNSLLNILMKTKICKHFLPIRQELIFLMKYEYFFLFLTIYLHSQVNITFGETVHHLCLSFL